MVRLSADDDRPAGEPLLRVVRGDASPEEIAGLVAVLMARSGVPGGEGRRSPRPPVSAWADRSRQLRRPLHPGPGAWRRSALPG
jgi:Acyl-CoA carboxylase epsilon subunit